MVARQCQRCPVGRDPDPVAGQWYENLEEEETFQVLWGEMYIDIDGDERLLRPGDTAVVLPGAWHKFRTERGCVVAMPPRFGPSSTSPRR